jgi:uncharacterized protein (DUF1810 family)
MGDRYNLNRFVEAQRGVYGQALSELQQGHKRSHWMWFVFPQIAGLGFSAMAQRYGITSLDEAVAYLQHPILGDRLRTCTDAVNAVIGRSANEIFGSPDDMKFRSCMTLFAHAEPADLRYSKALKKYYNGQVDLHTVAKLRGS